MFINLRRSDKYLFKELSVHRSQKGHVDKRNRIVDPIKLYLQEFYEAVHFDGLWLVLSCERYGKALRYIEN